MRLLQRALLLPVLALLAMLAIPAGTASAFVGCNATGLLQYSQTYGAVQGNSGAWCTHSGWNVYVSTKMYRNGTLVGSKSGTCASRQMSSCSIGIISATRTAPADWTLKISISYEGRTNSGEVSARI